MNALGLMFLLLASFTLVIWAVLTASMRSVERYANAVSETTESSLQNLFVMVDTRKVVFINLAMIVALPVIAYYVLDSVIWAIVAVVLALAMPRIVFVLLEKRRRRNITEALPDTLAQIAGAMRAGSTFPMAIQTMVSETKGPIGQEFDLVLREQRVGVTMEEALDNMAERVMTEEMDLVVSAALIARDVGGNLAEILMSLSVTLRRKLDMEGKIAALTAQGKLQGWVVSLLPFAVIAALLVFEPDAMWPIFTSLLGWAFLAVIIILEICGGFLIKKIVTIDI
jgi:tight adherence protein B